MKVLGQTTAYKYDRPDVGLLERFAAPRTLDLRQTISIRAPEFTSLCPITGQPDFATIAIDYCPIEWCVESKSLKLYLGCYRMHGEFHESCVAHIAEALVQLLEPQWLEVRGEFTPRGGISFWPTSRYERP